MLSAVGAVLGPVGCLEAPCPHPTGARTLWPRGGDPVIVRCPPSRPGLYSFGAELWAWFAAASTQQEDPGRRPDKGGRWPRTQEAAVGRLQTAPRGRGEPAPGSPTPTPTLQTDIHGDSLSHTAWEAEVSKATQQRRVHVLVLGLALLSSVSGDPCSGGRGV